jgi:hypothetical protein
MHLGKGVHFGGKTCYGCLKSIVIATPRAGEGTTFLLWEDVWNGNLLKREFLRLFSYAKRQNSSLCQYFMNRDIHHNFHHNFHTPLAVEAMSEYHIFSARMDEVLTPMQGKD